MYKISGYTKQALLKVISNMFKDHLAAYSYWHKFSIYKANFDGVQKRAFLHISVILFFPKYNRLYVTWCINIRRISKAILTSFRSKIQNPNLDKV